MSSILCRRLVSSRILSFFSSSTEVSSVQNRLLHRSGFLLNSNDSNNENPNPLVPQPVPAVLDKYLVPVTVMATGAMLSPGIMAMMTRPVHMWFYRRYYDWGFDVNEFLVGARRAMYYVAEKAFRKDFFGLKDVLTPEAMSDIREMAKDDSFRFYLNLRPPSTPILYEQIGAAGFVEEENQTGREDEHIQYYDRSSDASKPSEYRFEILVFFVCKIERLLASDVAKAAAQDQTETRQAIVERPEPGVKNYCRLLVMMTFSRLLERRQEQTSDWLVSSLALVPLQFTFARRNDA